MKIKKDWLIGGLFFFILFIIAYELRYYWVEPRQTPSEAGALVYRTGSGSELQGIFIIFVGVAAPIVWFTVARRMFRESTNLWKRSQAVALGVLGVLASMFMLSEVLSAVFYFPHGKEITVDLSSEVIILKKPYLLKKSAIQEIPFAKISHIEYKKFVHIIGHGIALRAASVELHLAGGEVVHLSSDGPKNQWSLATAISKATDRHLIVREQ